MEGAKGSEKSGGYAASMCRNSVEWRFSVDVRKNELAKPCILQTVAKLTHLRTRALEVERIMI